MPIRVYTGRGLTKPPCIAQLSIMSTKLNFSLAKLLEKLILKDCQLINHLIYRKEISFSFRAMFLLRSTSITVVEGILRVKVTQAINLK